MNELKPIVLDNGVTLIHPLRTVDLQGIDELTDNLFEILNDKENTEYIPEKRIENKQKLSEQLFGVTLQYNQKLGYTHFIRLKANNEVLGQINIITPKAVKLTSSYNIENSWFIEYFLNKKVWGFGIMSKAIKAIVQNMKEQGVETISALCMPENIASIKILEKSGFKRIKRFDLKQDLYQL